MIFNWGEKSKKVCDASIYNCSNCNHLAPFEIRTDEKTAGMFFISMAKWGKKYYLVCQNCSAGFPVLEDKVEETLRIFTEAPSHNLSAEIYKELKDVLVNGNYFSSEEKLSKYPEEVMLILKEKGYKEKDIKYITPIALKEFFRHLDKTKSE